MCVCVCVCVCVCACVRVCVCACYDSTYRSVEVYLLTTPLVYSMEKFWGLSGYRTRAKTLDSGCTVTIAYVEGSRSIIMFSERARVRGTGS